jgi:hypothetical protein
MAFLDLADEPHAAAGATRRREATRAEVKGFMALGGLDSRLLDEE